MDVAIPVNAARDAKVANVPAETTASVVMAAVGKPVKVIVWFRKIRIIN